MSQQVSHHPTLGEPIRRFERMSVSVHITFAVIAFLFGLGALWLNYLLFTGQMFILSNRIFIFAPIAVLMCFGLAMMLIVEATRHRGASIQLYSDGFAFIRRDDVQEFRWKDISEMRQTIAFFYQNKESVASQDRSYHLETHDGRKLRIGNEFKDVELLGKQIRQGISAVLLPQMIAAFDKGQTVDFGNLNLNKEGIEYKTKYLSWAEIEDAQISQGYVAFKKRGKWVHWSRIPASKTPNVLIFLALVDYAIGLKRGT